MALMEQKTMQTALLHDKVKVVVIVTAIHGLICAVHFFYLFVFLVKLFIRYYLTVYLCICVNKMC
jgi:hypothetical protein